MPVDVYAKKQTAKSYAEAGIHAMDQSLHNKNAKKDIFIAPENIFPEMGYGSHPEELIELVQDARKKMVEMLSEKYIEDPHARFDQELTEGKKHKLVPNPNFMGMSKKEAEKYANKHIKATLDTQHLGMWWKHFQPKAGETRDQRKKRFDKWYMEQIDKMDKAGVIGHIHAVDGMGGGHHHLPVGQGDMPIKKALEFLKKKGFKGTMVSEGHGEEQFFGKGRMMTQTWKNLGSPIVGVGYAMGAPQSWTDVHHGYFRSMQSPYFVFGSYSPSNDWQLWSQVPME